MTSNSTGKNESTVNLGQQTVALSIEQAQREWETAIDAVQDLIFIHDADMCIVRANRAYAVRAGKDIHDIIGKPYWKLFPKLDGPLPCCRQSLEEHQGGEEELHLGSGEAYVSRTYPIYDAEGKYLYSLHIMQDVTERKRMEERLNASLAEKEMLVQSLKELATRDGLTGLYNHRTFYKLLEDELARAQRFNRPVSLLMLDIDHFKHVNDTYGHLAGDAVIKGLSELLGRQARAIDRVCRYGGEEITVILPETGLEAAASMAERMRAAVEAQPFDINAGAPVRITVSIGVASWPAQADNVQTLMAAADAAMYAAKQRGRNRISRHEPAPDK